MTVSPRSSPDRERSAMPRLGWIVLLALAARAYHIERSWAPGDHDGWSGAFYSNIARNYLRYGYLETRLAPVVTTGTLPETRWVYYLTHPPGIGLAVSCSFLLFGEHEWSARLVPLVFGLGSIVLVYLLGAGLFSRAIGLLAALFVALTPMEILYGTHVDPQGPPVTFFSLAILEAYRRGSVRGVYLSLALGSAFDWPVHYVAGMVAGHSLLTTGFRRPKFLALPLASLLLVGAFALYAGSMAPRPEQNYLGRSLSSAGSFWMGTNVDPKQIPGHPLRWPGWFAVASRLWKYYRTLFTLPLLALAAVGLGVAASRPRRVFLLFILGWGALHVLLFPMGAFVHDYWSAYLTPGLSLAAALGAEWLSRQWKNALPSKVSFAVGVLGLVALGVFWIYVGWGRISRSREQRASLGYRLHEIAEPGQGILSLLPMDIRDAYYADRPVRDGVNRIHLFEEAMADPVVSYRYFVVPAYRIASRTEKPLFRHITGRYPHVAFEGLFIYDLSQPH